MNFDFNLIKERKKEIIIVAIYLIIFLVLIKFYNSFNTKLADKEFDVNFAKMQYDNIKNSSVSEADLEEELKALTANADTLNNKIPQGLKETTVYEMLAEISQNIGNMYNLGNCEVKELNKKDGYKCYEVNIKSFSGTYAQFKKFIKYINEYKAKVTIKELDIARNLSNLQGKLIIEFYGSLESEGAI